MIEIIRFIPSTGNKCFNYADTMEEAIGMAQANRPTVLHIRDDDGKILDTLVFGYTQRHIDAARERGDLDHVAFCEMVNGFEKRERV